VPGTKVRFDFRGHGRKAGIFEELLRKPPQDVDVLLLEGTNVRPAEDDGGSESIETETEVESACAELFRTTPGMVLAMFSSQNIDRLVTLFRASRKVNRTFVTTLYGNSIAEATGNDRIPKADWRDVRVYVPGWQQAKVKAAGYATTQTTGRMRLEIPDTFSIYF
jgi:ribonuclease J